MPDHVLGRITNLEFEDHETGEVTKLPDGVLSRKDDGMLRIDCDNGEWFEFTEGEIPTKH